MSCCRRKVFALVLVHFALGFQVDLVLDVQQFDFVIEEFVDLLEPFHRVRLFEDQLGISDFEVEIGRDDIGQFPGLLDVFDDDEDLVRNGFSQLAGLLEFLPGVLDHRLLLHVQLGRVLVLDLIDPGGQRLAVVFEAVDADARNSLDQDAQPAVGQLQHADDQGDGSEPEQVPLGGFLHVRVLLGQQQDHPIGVQGDVDRFLRFLPPHVQGDDHVGKYHDVAEDQHRQFFGDGDLFGLFFFVLFAVDFLLLGHGYLAI